jgi:signal transduction histidine kinase
MMQKTAARLAWSLWTLELVLIVAGGAMALAGSGRPGEAVLFVLIPTFQLTSATVGALIGSRHPANPIGWLFLAMALCWGIAGLATGVASLADGGVIPVTEWVRVADWFGSWAFLPGIIIPVTFLFLLFPGGHLLSPRWRWVAGISLTAVVLVVADAALAPGPIEDTVLLRENPYAIGDRAVWEAVDAIAWLAGILGIVSSAVALFRRFRRSSGDERQRIKWLAYAAVAVAVLFLIAATGFFTIGATGADPFAATVILQAIILIAMLIIPVATGIAMLRHRLFDIDLVISRTVVYGVLAAFVTVMYLGIVVGVGAVVGSRQNLLLSVVATALIALAFQPMRERARRLANRLVYGKRATPYEVMSGFAERMAGTYSLDEVLPRMARIAADGTGAERVEIWVRVGNELRLEASSRPGEDRPVLADITDGVPSIPGMDRAVPVIHQEEVLGSIAVAMPRSEPLAPTGEKLLGDLASQAGLVLRNVRLIEELRASRQRLVTAQDEERRRLERNIHDGAQQQLVALSVKMRLLKMLARRDPGKAEELVDQLQGEAQDALNDLRDLARGIYPPLLADQGLTAALEAQARKVPFPVRVEPNGIGRYPAEAEATAYFCVLEALQNAAKYAEASSATVRLGGKDGELVFSVTDDGRGFDPATTPPGSGLQNMADRLEAMGGTLEVSSRPGAGTTISGSIPVGV